MAKLRGLARRGAELLEVAEALQLDMSKTLRKLLEIGLAEMHAGEL